jgi:3'(2'), 5'-bisphosphate nucleotidase
MLSHMSSADLRARGDREANELIVAALAVARPDDGVLTEETEDQPGRRLQADRVWIIDPLDGTREFSIPERVDWAVHVALWERSAHAGQPGISAAAVALPALGKTYASGSPSSNQYPVNDGSVRIVVSASRPPSWMDDLSAVIPTNVTEMGSAGAKTMAVLRGDADAYLHAGGQYEWDSAAPVGVALAAGLHASRLDGTPLIYNQPSPYLPDLVVCRQDVAATLLAALAQIGAQ